MFSPLSTVSKVLVPASLYMAALLCGLPVAARAQTDVHVLNATPHSAAHIGPTDSGFGKLDTAPLPEGTTPDQLVHRFAAREAEFKKALDNYTWVQDVRVQDFNEDNKPSGEYHIVYDVTFDKENRRIEHVVFAPQNTLTKILMTQQDVDDIEHRLPFILTTENLPQYTLSYAGRQHVDDVDTYVFDAVPKELVKGKRYFQGRIWVDQKGEQIVIVSGQIVPDDTRPGHEDLSPPFTTYREKVDGKFWFPTYTKGEGTLVFHEKKNGPTDEVHIRQVVKYHDYKQFGSTIRIITEGEAPAGSENETPPPATPQK